MGTERRIEPTSPSLGFRSHYNVIVPAKRWTDASHQLSLDAELHSRGFYSSSLHSRKKELTMTLAGVGAGVPMEGSIMTLARACPRYSILQSRLRPTIWLGLAGLLLAGTASPATSQELGKL